MQRIVAGNTTAAKGADTEMAKGTLGQVVKRAISDAAFRRQLQSDPEGALKGFDLTGDERAALRSGDASKLSTLGIDQRMSKTFEMGAGASAVSKIGTGSDVSLGAPLPDGGSPLINDALAQSGRSASDTLIDDASGARAARISDVGGARSGLTSDGTGGRTALGDQHDMSRAAINDTTRLGQVNAAFDGGDSAAGGRTALGDQHDISRAAIGDSAAGGAQSSLDISGQTRDASVTSSDVAGRQTDAFITADEAGNNVVAGGSAGAQTSLDVSGQTRDTSVISSDVAGRQTDAFMTADEMGNDVAARGSASYPDSADTQREALANDAAMANPDGYTKPDVDA